MIGTNQRNDKLLEFIIKHKQDNDGIPPTIRQIIKGESLDFTSTSVVSYNLKKLVERGFITLACNGKIKVVGAQWIPPKLVNCTPKQTTEADVKPGAVFEFGPTRFPNSNASESPFAFRIAEVYTAKDDKEEYRRVKFFVKGRDVKNAENVRDEAMESILWYLNFNNDDGNVHQTNGGER